MVNNTSSTGNVPVRRYGDKQAAQTQGGGKKHHPTVSPSLGDKAA
jgi:hypothetical protein